MAESLESATPFENIPLGLTPESPEVGLPPEPTASEAEKKTKKSNSLKRFFSQKKLASGDDAEKPKRDSLTRHFNLRLGNTHGCKSEKQKEDAALESTESTTSASSSRYRLHGYLSNYLGAVFKKSEKSAGNKKPEKNVEAKKEEKDDVPVYDNACPV